MLQPTKDKRRYGEYANTVYFFLYTLHKLDIILSECYYEIIIKELSDL